MDAPAGHEADDLEQLEELGDDAIIAQQTAAHAPQPRANVVNEARSIVISDRPSDPGKVTGRHRARNEKTVIIRDRRKLDDMRQQLLARQIKKQRERTRLLYFWGAIGFLAFVLGGVVALFATGDPVPPEGAAAPALTPTPAPAEPGAGTEPKAEPAPQKPAQVDEAEAAPAVDLEELPLERRKPGTN